MSEYTVTTNFTAKDALAAGHADKVITGTGHGTEYANIATAVNSKADKASPTFTGTVALPTTLTIGGTAVTPSVIELNYVDGVTSAIQTQMDLKAPLASPTFTTALTAANPTFTGTVVLPATWSINGTTVTPTAAELNFVDGVSSAIQTQINTKAATASPTFSGTVSGSAGSFSSTFATGALTVTGAITATGEITAHFSDDRLKDRIAPLKDALSKVRSLDAFTYRQNALADSMVGVDKKVRVGVSAQQVQAVLPEAVCESPVGKEYLTVQADKLIPLLIAAVRELATEVDQLKWGAEVDRL